MVIYGIPALGFILTWGILVLIGSNPSSAAFTALVSTLFGALINFNLYKEDFRKRKEQRQFQKAPGSIPITVYVVDSQTRRKSWVGATTLNAFRKANGSKNHRLSEEIDEENWLYAVNIDNCLGFFPMSRHLFEILFNKYERVPTANMPPSNLAHLFANHAVNEADLCTLIGITTHLLPTLTDKTITVSSIKKEWKVFWKEESLPHA